MSQAGLVSLTFDDALAEHLDRAIPLLDQHGLRGTFYTHITAPSLTGRWHEWQRAAASGHELGNHTVFHPAEGRKPWVKPGNAIESYSLDRMRQELDAANDVLRMLDGQNQRTFAYPCSNPFVGQRGYATRFLQAVGCERTRLMGWVDRYHFDPGATRESYQPVTASLFPAARCGGLTWEQPVGPWSQFQTHALPSVAIDGTPFEVIQKYVADGLERRTWVILQFHGIGGGHHMDCEWSVFQRLITWLSEPSRAAAVVTVLDGARRTGLARD